MKLEQRSNDNPFVVDPESDVPVGVQLTWRLRTLILAGRLRAGEALPSVRRLAAWAGVNANTVRSVYDSLHGEGLVEARPGKGTYVSPGAVALPELESIVQEAVTRGRRSGMKARDLAVALMACAEILGDESPEAGPEESASGGDTLEIRLELRRQIAQLESELASYVRDAPTGPASSPSWSLAHVTDVEELEKTRDVLFQRLSEARQNALDRARRESEARVRQSKPAQSADAPLARAMNWWRQAMEPRSTGDPG